MINRKRVLRYLPNNYASLIFSDKKEVLKQIHKEIIKSDAFINRAFNL
jgi:hypothetical protein